MRWQPLAILPVFIACSDDRPRDPTEPLNARASLDAGDVPKRGTERPSGHLSNVSDSAMWEYAAKTDTMFVVGLKRPATTRGFYRGRWYVLPAEWHSYARDLPMAGATLVSVDTLLPHARVKIENYAVLAVVRQLPFIDFVEPARLRIEYSSGCDWETFSEPSVLHSSGDILPRHFQGMRIPAAWGITSGRGVWIGLTDTGIHPDQPQFGAEFALGSSSGRLFPQTSTTSGYPGDCSHGTRAAGIMAAPMDGANVVGVAWGANVYSVHQAHRVWDVNSTDATQAIRDAGNWGARVIVMAWQVMDNLWSDAVSDEIDGWYYNQDRVFVGAAGTSECWLSQNNVVFPAEKREVIAVSASEPDGSRPCKSHYGPELDVVAYHHQETTGMASGAVVWMSESSNATAIVGGIAALVRARFETMPNSEVRNRLIATSDTLCGLPKTWHNLVNASAAVGGMCLPKSAIFGPGAIGLTITEPYQTHDYTVNFTGGIGPFTYKWSNGATTKTATYDFDLRSDYKNYTEEISVQVKDLGNAADVEVRVKVVQVNYIRTSPDDPCPAGETCTL